MTDILFYHLTTQKLETVLPNLLEKTLERGWKALVQVGSAERLTFLDEALWTYKEESFLPHCRAEEEEAEHSPLLLSTSFTRKNQPDVLFLIDQAPFPEDVNFTRIVILFNGEEEEALAQARLMWKNCKTNGYNASYWQQQQGRWQQKA